MRRCHVNEQSDGASAVWGGAPKTMFGRSRREEAYRWSLRHSFSHSLEGQKPLQELECTNEKQKHKHPNISCTKKTKNNNNYLIMTKDNWRRMMDSIAKASLSTLQPIASTQRHGKRGMKAHSLCICIAIEMTQGMIFLIWRQYGWNAAMWTLWINQSLIHKY